MMVAMIGPCNQISSSLQVLFIRRMQCTDADDVFIYIKSCQWTKLCKIVNNHERKPQLIFLDQYLSTIMHHCQVDFFPIYIWWVHVIPLISRLFSLLLEPCIGHRVYPTPIYSRRMLPNLLIALGLGCFLDPPNSTMTIT